MKLVPLGFQKPRPSKPTFQLPQHLYPSCLAQLAVFTCCPLLFLGGLICFDGFSSVNCSEDGPRNGAIRQKDVTCSIAWSRYIRIDFFNMFFLNTSEKITVVYINESISFDIDIRIEICTLSQLGYQKVSWKADRLVMLSSMLGNSEGQWRLLHLRQAEKVRAVIGSKLKIPKCSNDVWIDRVFFEKNGMYEDLYWFIYLELF